MLAPAMCDYQTVSQIFDVLFSLGIHRENVKLGPTIGNFEVQMGVTFEYEDLEKMWEKIFKFNL